MPSSLRPPNLPSPVTIPASTSRIGNLVRTAVTLFFWYCISSAIILTTKWLFTYHFSYPLTVTTFSNTITTVWAFSASRFRRFRPEPLTRKQFFEYVLPIGITTALEIGFSNIALKLLTVSFGTILKGGAPIFTMLWGLLYRVETFSANLFLALFTIASGIALASLGEGHEFAFNGFILQLLATALGGLRWTITHKLLKGSTSDAMPPITATLYTSPTTALCVLPFAVGLEAIPVWNHEFKDGELRTVLLTMLLVASLVFFLLVSEYWLVNATSSLALSVAGVVKELLTIGGGIFIFQEHLSFFNSVGFIICQMGIFAYIYLRYDPNDTLGYTRAPASAPGDGQHDGFENSMPTGGSVDTHDHSTGNTDLSNGHAGFGTENPSGSIHSATERVLVDTDMASLQPTSVNFSIDDDESQVAETERDSGTTNTAVQRTEQPSAAIAIDR